MRDEVVSLRWVSSGEEGDPVLAAVLEAVGQMPLKDVPRPEPGPGEVIVRVKACGICQTDGSVSVSDRRPV